MKALVGAYNQEKALVGAFSVITNLQMDFFEALVDTMAGHWALNEVDCVPVTRVVRHKKPRNLHPEFQSGFIK